MIRGYDYRQIHSHTPWDPDTTDTYLEFYNPDISLSYLVAQENIMFEGSKTSSKPNFVCLWLFASIPKWSDEIWADAKEGGGRGRGG